MSRWLLQPGLNFLRVLIVVGALVSIMQPSTPYRIRQLTFITDNEWAPQAFALDGRSIARLALTAISLSLL